MRNAIRPNYTFVLHNRSAAEEETCGRAFRRGRETRAER